MPFLNEFYKLKKKVVNILVSDEELMTMVANQTPKEMPAKYLIDQVYDDGSYHPGQIHLYDFIPGQSSSAETHICVEVVEGPVDTIFVGKFYLNIDVFVPESLMNMYGNIRRDAIAARIDKLLNGQHLVLAQLERVPGGLSKPIQGWRQRFLGYEVVGWNRSYDSEPT